MYIRDLLLKQQRKLFVGRQAEISLLHQITSTFNKEWKWLNIHGQSGMGKTVLLRLFAQEIEETHCFYFDGHSGFQKPIDFLTRLRLALDPEANMISASSADRFFDEVVQAVNHYAIQNNGLILLLDSFEQWDNIADWIRDEWLPALHPLIRICSAGRQPLRGKWQRAGLHSIFHNIELQPLSEIEVEQYTKNCGIEDVKLSRSLYQFCKGVPLALSLACEVILRNQNSSFLNNQQQTEVIGNLVAELMQDISHPTLQTYLEAVAMVWRFDQDLLQALLQEKVPTQLFYEFCQLPFVMRHENSWLLHDSIRQWIYTDLKNRMPLMFQTYRGRALEAIQAREKLQHISISEVTVDKMYLYESDFVRSFCFHWEDNVTLRECDLEDVERIEELYRIYLHSQNNYIPDEMHLESLIRPLMDAASSGFIGIWKEDLLIAFCACIPLREETVRILRENPITAPATARYTPNGDQYLLTLMGLDPNREHDIGAAISRTITMMLDKQGSFIDLTFIEEWFPILPLLGFERAEWADSTTPNGVNYQAFLLEQNIEKYVERIDRLLSTFDAAMTKKEDKPLSLEEITQIIKEVLKNYNQLHLKPQLIAPLRGRILEEDLINAEEQLALSMQKKIIDALKVLAGGAEEDRELSQLIKYAYIQKIGSHEMVAERINLSVPTYYRYLKKAIDRLVYVLTYENEPVR